MSHFTPVCNTFIPNMPSNTWALLWEWNMDENSQQEICQVKISLCGFMEVFSWLGKRCIYTCVHTFKPVHTHAKTHILHTCASRFEEQLRQSDSGEKRKGKKRRTDEDLLSWVSCGTTLYYEPSRKKINKIHSLLVTTIRVAIAAITEAIKSQKPDLQYSFEVIWQLLWVWYEILGANFAVTTALMHLYTTELRLLCVSAHNSV